MGVAWKLQIPVIGLSSCTMYPWLYDRSGNPESPSYIPTPFLQHNEKMSFFQRFYNFVDHHFLKILNRYTIDAYTDRILKEKFGNDIPPVAELNKNISLIFINQHYSMSGSRPLSPSSIEIGGIHIQEKGTVNQKFKNFLDNASDGVIYVSWGSIIRAASMAPEKLDSLLKAFGSFKQKILWKYEEEITENKPSNVFLHKWLPQREILCHPNVRVFFTHGGMSSSMEAINCAKPIIVTPLFADQSLNAAALVNRGVATILPYKDINVENIKHAVEKALNPDTKLKMDKISFSFRNRIKTPLETALWWVEHVAATRGAPLAKSYSVHLPGYVYHSLDVCGVLLIGLFLWATICVYIIKKICLKKTINLKVKTN